LDPASSGWHLTPRAWRASEVYRGLRTAEARHVAELVLFDRPRFQDETHYFGGKAFTVLRGQLFDSEETLAAVAGTSRKVVRTVIAGLQVAGLVARERACGGARSPWVITVRDYDLSQRLPSSSGPRAGPREGQQRAREEAPSKPQEPHEPQEAISAARAPAEVLDLALAPPPTSSRSDHQRAVVGWFSAWDRSGRGKHPTLTGAEAAAIKRLVADLGVDELLVRFQRAFDDPWFVAHGDLLTFRRQVSKFAPPGRPGGAAAAPPAAPAGPWDDLVARVRREGPHGWADKFLAPLRAHRRGERLELQAPAGYPLAFVIEEWAGRLADWVAEAYGQRLQVQLLEQRQASGTAAPAPTRRAAGAST
jgi:hypothetical protein